VRLLGAEAPKSPLSQFLHSDVASFVAAQLRPRGGPPLFEFPQILKGRGFPVWASVPRSGCRDGRQARRLNPAGFSFAFSWCGKLLTLLIERRPLRLY
jgi:hypothetical protein